METNFSKIFITTCFLFISFSAFAEIALPNNQSIKNSHSEKVLYTTTRKDIADLANCYHYQSSQANLQLTAGNDEAYKKRTEAMNTLSNLMASPAYILGQIEGEPSPTSVKATIDDAIQESYVRIQKSYANKDLGDIYEFSRSCLDSKYLIAKYQTRANLMINLSNLANGKHEPLIFLPNEILK